MTGTETTADAESNAGSSVLIELPIRIHLPESRILTGIRRKDALERVNLLTVLYDVPPDVWVGSVLIDSDDTPAKLGIVSIDDHCRSVAAQSGSTSESAPVGTADDRPLDLITPLQDPADLDGLDGAISRYIDAWADTDSRTVVLFDSVSSLLDAVETTDGLRFLRTLQDRITSESVTGFFVVHPERHAPETTSELRSVFDDVVTHESLERDHTAEDTGERAQEGPVN